MNLFDRITLEIRPRLKSVNVFVALKKDSSPKIKLNHSSFSLTVDDVSENVECEKGMEIVSNSLSSLQYSDGFVYFRFNYENGDFGRYKMELLKSKEEKRGCENEPEPIIKQCVYCTILCNNCNEVISISELQFSRVLPLPATSSDPLDWFCDCDGTATKKKIKLVPKESEIFFSNCFFTIHKNNMPFLNSTNDVLICNYCSDWVGLINTSDTYKLWNNTVQVQYKHNSQSVSSNGLNDFFLTVRSVFGSNFFDSPKIILKCESVNVQVEFILLWILEKDLQVLVNEGGEVSKSDVAKVLFKLVGEENENLVQWQKELSVPTILISKPMLKEGLNHLLENNNRFPKKFQESNGFKVSYLYLYKFDK